MKPKATPTSPLDLFHAHFKQILNLDHELCRLAGIGANLRKLLAVFWPAPREWSEFYAVRRQFFELLCAYSTHVIA